LFVLLAGMRLVIQYISRWSIFLLAT
jgi:hypothetical protein